MLRLRRAGQLNGHQVPEITRAVNGIDGDVKLNRALWVMTENMLALSDG